MSDELTKLAEKHIEQLRRYALVNLDGDVVLADQAVCDAVTAVWRTRGSANWERSTLQTKLIQAMKHRCMNIKRGLARQAAHTVPIDDVPENELPLVDPWIRLDEIHSVRQAIATLEPADQFLVTKYYLEGFSLREIATKVGKSHQWVQDRLKVCLGLMRKELE